VPATVMVDLADLHGFVGERRRRPAYG